jgi:hypothetical protein
VGDGCSCHRLEVVVGYVIRDNLTLNIAEARLMQSLGRLDSAGVALFGPPRS